MLCDRPNPAQKFTNPRLFRCDDYQSDLMHSKIQSLKEQKKESPSQLLPETQPQGKMKTKVNFSLN